VLATRAVGAANAAIGIHTARQDSVPLVALIGQVKREFRGREAFQETDLATSIGSLALWAGEARDATDAVRLMGEGLRRQSRGRQGPILLSLPEDVLDELVDGAAETSAAQPAGSADRSAVRQVLHLLAASERGVILAGGGVLRARASKRLTALSEAMAVPVIAAWRRPDVFPNAHPNYLGMTGYWAAPTVRRRLLDADVMLVLGCRLSEVASFGYSVPAPATRWAHVDLEPRASGHGLSAPSLALAADAARFLDAAWSELRNAALDAEMRGRRERGIAEDREAYLAASRVDEEPWDGPGVHPGRVITTLQRLLPSDSLISTDAGNFGGWAARGYRFMRPGTFVGPTSGAMGYGLPAAIAASLLRPDRPAVALCGDGGFAMTMSELETAVREHVRPIAIVFDNRQYGTIHMHQERDGHMVAGTDLGAIDFAAAARAFGASGYSVQSDSEFEPALVAALAGRAPAVIHLRLDPRWVSVDQTPGSDQVASAVGRDIASAP
jgi:acetolactate synthase-1/2/3 large subunit